MTNTGDLSANSSLLSKTSWPANHEGQHEDLHKMCCIDMSTLTRLVPNSTTIPLDNDCFSGHVFLMVRTPDVDSKKASKPEGVKPLEISDYMKGRQRRFEFQFRVKLKKVPTGPLFLGCEVEEAIKVGRITKTLVNFLLAMIRRINPGFHYSWGIDPKTTTEEEIETGNYEKCHLAFPVEASMDRIVITKPGEELPEMGQELPESNESVKRRRKMGAGSIDWNTEDTYTMCLWSAYVDWIQWRCMNVAGIRPFALGNVLGTQPIYLSVYEVKNISNDDYRKERPAHTRANLDIYSRLEFSHIHKTEGGQSDKLLGDHHIETESIISNESDLFESKLSASEHEKEAETLADKMAESNISDS